VVRLEETDDDTGVLTVTGDLALLVAITLLITAAFAEDEGDEDAGLGESA
jgi:hypothetical protein